MEKPMVRIADLVTGLIEGGQFTASEEASLMELLVQRTHEQEGMSLAGYIEREAKDATDLQLERLREIQNRLYRYCIRGSSIGNKRVSELTADDIRRYIIKTAESYEMDKNSWFVFLTMLQRALDAMSFEGVLGFQPPAVMHLKFYYLAQRKQGVERPYVGVEWRKIRGWLEQNPQDAIGLALALWYEGEISPEEIIGLKRTDLLDSDGNYSEFPSVIKKNTAEDYLLLTKKRKQIIHAALNLYPGADREYVFMIEGKKRLKKLPKKSLQSKMESICGELGLVYKSFRCTDMILWGLH